MENKILKPCPFCGNDDIECAEIKNPTVWWDSALRGEDGYAVYCFECGASIKDNYEESVIMKWNARYANYSEIKEEAVKNLEAQGISRDDLANVVTAVWHDVLKADITENQDKLWKAIYDINERIK